MAVNEYGGPIPLGGHDSFVGLEVGQVSVTTSYTTVVAIEGNRAYLTLHNSTTNVDIFVGPDTSVTTTNGFPLHAGEYITWPYAGALYGIVATGTGDLSFAKIKA